MKKAVIACLFLGVTVLGAGCSAQGTQQSNDRTEYSQEDPTVENTSVEDASVDEPEEKSSDNEQTSQRTVSPDKLNHGYSITEHSEPYPKEMLRSEEVLYDEEEAKAFLLDNILYPEREPYTFEMTDSSKNDPGAYLWYDFTVFYDGIPVEGAVFTVITFNDGTILEGDEGFFRIIPEDRSNIKTPEEILEDYAKQNSDDRDYVYQTGHYYYMKKSGECPYVYVYRYDCGKVLENITLTLNAKTGERLGFRPDAID